MEGVKIAVAQVTSIKGDINKNIAIHLKALSRANQLGVQYIVFPELSLMGYEPKLAAELAFSRNDKRLKPLADAAIQHNITIAVGVPFVSDKLPTIAICILRPSGDLEIYQKMHLHPGEEGYFSAGSEYHSLEINGVKIVNAICADTNHPSHAQYCADIDAHVYIAGVLISESGYICDCNKLAGYAKKYNLLVAIANHNKPTGGWKPIGKSAIWSPSGLLAQADETQDALLVAERKDNQWSAQVIEI